MPNIYVNPNAVVASSQAVAKTTTVKKVKTVQAKPEKQTKFELDNGLVIQVLPYKETKPTISTSYIVNELTEHSVKNGTQTADPAKIAICHLAVITNEVNKIPYESVKTEKNKWEVITSKQIDYNINNDLYLAFGFGINKATRVTSFYKDNANYSVLNNTPLDKVQETYDSIVQAALKSHEINPKNNLFTKAHYQQSAFLLELNDVMKKVRVTASIFSEDIEYNDDDSEENLIDEVMEAHVCDENCEHENKQLEDDDDEDEVIVYKAGVVRTISDTKDKEEYYGTLI